jgi:hypothetical protein
VRSADRLPRCPHMAGRHPLPAVLVRFGGVDWDTAARMPCPDVHPLAVLLIRSQALTAMGRRLHGAPTPPADRPFTRGSARLAAVMWGLAALSVLFFCTFLGRIIL